MRGFNIFMAIERDRYYGAAIDQHGKLEAAWLPPLLAALAEVDWPSLRRATPIALVDMRADTRFGARDHVLDPMTPVLADVLGLGPGGAAELGPIRPRSLRAAGRPRSCRALELAQVPYTIVDEAASEDELARYRAVIAPDGDRIDRGLWHAPARARRAQARDRRDRPEHADARRARPAAPRAAAPAASGKLKAGSLDDLAGLAEDLAALAGELPDTWQVERPDDVRTAIFADADRDGARDPRDLRRPRSATAVLFADRALRDVLTNEHFELRDGRISVPMAAGAVRLLAEARLSAACAVAVVRAVRRDPAGRAHRCPRARRPRRTRGAGWRRGPSWQRGAGLAMRRSRRSPRPRR